MECLGKFVWKTSSPCFSLQQQLQCSISKKYFSWQNLSLFEHKFLFFKFSKGKLIKYSTECISELGLSGKVEFLWVFKESLQTLTRFSCTAVAREKGNTAETHSEFNNSMWTNEFVTWKRWGSPAKYILISLIYGWFLNEASCCCFLDLL